MLRLLWLVPALPLAGAVVLALFGGTLGRRRAAVVGVGSVATAAAITILIAIAFLTAPPAGDAYTQTLWRWFEVAGFRPAIALRLDALSLLMALVVTFVGALIHLYSAEFMWDDEGFTRFFAYMNLFVASMLTLVLAPSLLCCSSGGRASGSASTC